MIVQKVQLSTDDVAKIETICQGLGYKSKSEFMRLAIIEKIRDDRKKMREYKRQEAMKGYAGVENVFESIEGDDFERR